MDSELLFILAQMSQPRAVAARAFRSSVQSFGAGGADALAWTDTDFETGGMSVGSSGITVPFTGYYVVTGKVQWSAASGSATALPSLSRGYVQILVNSTVEHEGQEFVANGTAAGRADVSTILFVPATEVINLQSQLVLASGNAWAWAAASSPEITNLSAAFLGS